MSQLKQDEWPAEDELTTTESQVPTSSPEEARGRQKDDGDPGFELSNVTPDQQVD